MRTITCEEDITDTKDALAWMLHMLLVSLVAGCGRSPEPPEAVVDLYFATLARDPIRNLGLLRPTLPDVTIADFPADFHS